MQDDRKDPEYQPPMPPCAALYLVAYLLDVGCYVETGNGRVPLTEQELQAWQWNMGFELPPWETRMLRRLSTVFINETALAVKPECPAPWTEEPEENDRAAIAVRVRNLWRG